MKEKRFGIRKFKLEDALAVTRMHRATIRTLNAKDYSQDEIKAWTERSTVDRLKKSDHTHRYVAISRRGSVLGFAHYNPKETELRALYVSPRAQGEGVGSALLEKVEEEALKDGIKQLQLSSTITAKGFYESHGYKVVKESFHEIKAQKLKVYEMRKKLS